MDARFVFAVCQPGFEAALKQEVARRSPDLRFAFSRPGFVTFRAPENAPPRPLTLPATFARTSGESLGKVRGASTAALAADLWQKLSERFAPRDLADFKHLHIWQRDRELPGDLGFDPAIPAAAADIGEAIRAARPAGVPAPLLNESAVSGERVLDCVLVEPNEWWFGGHFAAAPETRWPGGVPPLHAPSDMISRAYLKIEEALLWSELPVRAGDRCVEIGSAPGGACQALLARGCLVTGIDPADMDPRVLEHPNFTFVRGRAKDLKRSVFRDCRWLMSDANVAPNYTLDTVEAIVTHRDVRVEGLVLTLKLTDQATIAKLPSLAERVRSWGYARVRVRQLAYNRRELCLIAARTA
jgi:23S rRNA (cytidine2498-2'-O)-methyltransferase